MNFKLTINDLDIQWAFKEVTVYNNAFHTNIVKQYFYHVWAVHKTDPTQPHTGHSGPVILSEVSERIPEFIEFKDLTHEDLVRWTKRNIDTRVIYDLLIKQLRDTMVYRNLIFPFAEEDEDETSNTN